MNPLLKIRLQILRNWCRHILARRWELVKAVGVILFGLLLIGCLYWWFGRVLRYLAGVPTVGVLLTNKLFEIAFLSAFSLIALSAMVTALATHFGSSDLSLLLSLPIRHVRVFFLKTWETIFHASWMIALVLVPFLTALARIRNLDPGFLVLAFALFIPFAISAAAGGVALAILFASMFPRRKLSEFLSVLGILIFVFLYAGIRLTLPQKLMEPDKMEQVLEYILYLQSPAAPFLPSRWYVGALNAYMAHDWIRFIEAAGFLALFTLGAWALLFILGRWVLTPRRWTLALEGSGSGQGVNFLIRGVPDDQAKSKQSYQVCRQSLWALLFLKEIRFFFRDSQRFSNASFILAVCAIYLVSIYRLPMDTPHLKNFLSFVNLAIGLFIIAALSLRFCFPQPSLELPYCWILRASPLATRSFLGAKLIFNIIFLNSLGLVLVILSPFLLGTDKQLIPLYSAASVAAGTFLAVLSLAVGSAFPKPRYENIIQIETSFGGFLYGVCSLAYVALTLAVFAWPIRYYFQSAYLNKMMTRFDFVWLGVLGVLYLGLSLGLGCLSWLIACRAWANLAKSEAMG